MTIVNSVEFAHFMKELLLMSAFYIHSQHIHTYAHRILAQKNKANCKVMGFFCPLLLRHWFVHYVETQEFI